jgi:glycine hydroxymethyltransferase
VENAKMLAQSLKAHGYRIVSGGTDNHQVLVDLTTKGLNGAAAENVLEAAGIVLNRNVIPSDAHKPGSVLGLRLGSAGLTTRGMGQSEMITIAGIIDTVLSHPDDPTVLNKTNHQVKKLCRRYPVYA